MEGQGCFSQQTCLAHAIRAILEADRWCLERVSHVGTSGIRKGWEKIPCVKHEGDLMTTSWKNGNDGARKAGTEKERDEGVS